MQYCILILPNKRGTFVHKFYKKNAKSPKYLQFCHFLYCRKSMGKYHNFGHNVSLSIAKDYHTDKTTPTIHLTFIILLEAVFSNSEDKLCIDLVIEWINNRRMQCTAKTRADLH